METVYRYEINEAINEIELPIGAEVLYTGLAQREVDAFEEAEAENKEMSEDRAKILRNLGRGASLLMGGQKNIQKEVISIWAKVDTDSHTEKRKFLVFGTGADMSKMSNFRSVYLGTVVKKNMYAFHVFEVSDK